jgi:hypothetical protein
MLTECMFLVVTNECLTYIGVAVEGLLTVRKTEWLLLYVGAVAMWEHATAGSRVCARKWIRCETVLQTQ